MRSTSSANRAATVTHPYTAEVSVLRRPLAILALAAATLAASACASPTGPAPAPRQECANTQSNGVCR